MAQGQGLQRTLDCRGDQVWEVGSAPHPHGSPWSPCSDKAKLSSCQVIVHCLAGISRSAAIAIAYIMKTMGMSSDDAYRYLHVPVPTSGWGGS